MTSNPNMTISDALNLRELIKGCDFWIQLIIFISILVILLLWILGSRTKKLNKSLTGVIFIIILFQLFFGSPGSSQSRPCLDVEIQKPRIFDDPERGGLWINSNIIVINRSNFTIRLLEEPIQKEIFSGIVKNGKELYYELQKNGYIDRNGNQTEKFFMLKDNAQDFILSDKYRDQKNMIFDMMNYRFNKYLFVTDQTPGRDYQREYRRDKLFYGGRQSLIPGDKVVERVVAITGYPTKFFSILCKIKYNSDDVKESPQFQIVYQQIYEICHENGKIVLVMRLDKKYREGDKNISKYFSGTKVPYLVDYSN